MVKFEKVSYEQFLMDCETLENAGVFSFSHGDIKMYYDTIILPRRATAGSAGYDFYLPFPVAFAPVAPVWIPTGIRVLLEPGQFLMCVPRSGLGFKYGARLVNTTGVIDSDYARSSNEGHIMAKMLCDKAFQLKDEDRFMQGIILNYAVTDDDDPIKKERDGGFGSTGACGG